MKSKMLPLTFLIFITIISKIQSQLTLPEGYPYYQIYITPDSVNSVNIFDNLMTWYNKNDFTNYRDNTKFFEITANTIDNISGYTYFGNSTEKSWKIGGNSTRIFDEIYSNNFRKRQISLTGLNQIGVENSFKIFKENWNTWVVLNQSRKTKIQLNNNSTGQTFFQFRDNNGYYIIGNIKKKVYAR